MSKYDRQHCFKNHILGLRGISQSGYIYISQNHKALNNFVKLTGYLDFSLIFNINIKVLIDIFNKQSVCQITSNTKLHFGSNW